MIDEILGQYCEICKTRTAKDEKFCGMIYLCERCGNQKANYEKMKTDRMQERSNNNSQQLVRE